MKAMSALGKTMWVATVLCGLAGCVESIPKLGGPPTDPGTAINPPSASTEPSPSRLVVPVFNAESVQQMKGQNTAVQRDARCEQSVVPSVTGNIAGLATLLAQTEMKNQVANLPSLFNRAAPAAPQTNAWATVKIAARYLTWLPFPVEERIGEYTHQEYADLLPRDGKPGQRLYQELDEKLANLLNSVSDPHEYKLKAFIRKRSEKNAVASAGGYLYIDQGLFDKQGKLTSEGLFALAHEVSHILQRHETYNIQSRILDSVEGVQQAVTLINGIQRNDDKVLLNVAQLFASKRNQFGRFYADQELHADNCAVRLLSQANISDTEFKRVIQSFAQRVSAHPEHDDEHKRDFVSIVNRPIDRHPGGKARMNNLLETTEFWVKKRSARGNSGK